MKTIAVLTKYWRTESAWRKKFFAGDGFVAKSQQSPPRWALAGHADVKLSTRWNRS